MNSEREPAPEEPLDFDEDLMVDELCEYMARLDRGDVDPSNARGTVDIPIELQQAIQDCRGVLDILDQTRSRTGFPVRASAIENFGGYTLPSRIGRFDIIERLGFGGYGVVFRGVDPETEREVAIKVPRPEFLESPELIHRFAREASIVAQLKHPNIVSIQESDCYGIVPYIAMDFLPGKTLSEWRTEQSEISPRAIAKILHDLALAVAHAHERGVLHRDLKPGNVILVPDAVAAVDNEFSLIPVLTDFGIAHCISISSGHTRTGAMVGTLRYMSPEQIEGRPHDITNRTDVYGLGTILYEMLTGVPPYHSVNKQRSLQDILREAPVSPRTIRPRIPLELEVICLKCMEKMPKNRYSSASALADDLQRFLNGVPIRARAGSWISIIRNWVRRYPVLASVLGMGIGGLCVLLGLTLWFNSQLTQLLSIAESERATARQNEWEARRHELVARHRAYAADLHNAKISFDQGNLRQTIKLLDRQKPKGGEIDIRGFDWWCLWNMIDQSSRLLAMHQGEVSSVAISSKGDLAASGGADRLIQLFSMPAGTPLAVLRGHELKVTSLSFSPDGQRLASVGEDGTLRVWDTVRFKELFVCRGHESPVYAVQYSPTGNIIASAGADTIVRLWNARDGEAAGVLSGHTDRILCLAFHPTEETLVTGGADATIRFWDLSNRCPDSRISGGAIPLLQPKRSPHAIVVEPNGKSLVVAVEGAGTFRYSLESGSYGHVLQQLNEHAGVNSLTWPSKGSLVAGLESSEIRVGELIHPEMEGEWRRGHQAAVSSIATPADGSFLLSGSKDGQIRYWPHFFSQSRINIASDSASRIDRDPRFYSVQWHEQFLAADLQQEQVSIYRMPKKTLERTIAKGNSDDYALSPSGRFLLIRQNDGIATLFRVNGGDIVWKTALPPSPNRVQSGIAINRSETLALVACELELLVVDTHNSQIVSRLTHPDIVRAQMFLETEEDRQTAISTCADGIIRFWDTKTGTLLKQRRVSTDANFLVALSNDRQFIPIVFGGTGRQINVWRSETMELESSLPLPSSGESPNLANCEVAFLKSTKILLKSDAGIYFWDAQNEAETLAFSEFGHSGTFALSPDRRQIAIPLRGHIQLLDGTPK